MFAKQVNDESPLRILEQSIHGGLGAGNLGVVMAHAGVGKTACLVQIGLDDVLRGRPVFHVALGQTLEHVQSWYDALFNDLAERTSLEDREAVRKTAASHRVIKAFADHALTAARLAQALELFTQHLGFRPAAILVDGFAWDPPGAPAGSVATTLEGFRALAKRVGAELWLSAQTHRVAAGGRPVGLTPPCAAFADLIDVALFLEPHGDHVDVRILKDHGDARAAETQLHLHPDTMRLVSAGATAPARRSIGLPTGAHTLLSGGAEGTEAEFGACAERWGVAEMNYTFSGRGITRMRGVVELSAGELTQGDVSSAYFTQHMHRSYPDSALFRKVLQSIWHQVNSAGEVFVVGSVQDDGTVKGGTGWAAELAKHWKKPVHIYEQERRTWLRWAGTEWAPEASPRICATRFTGTGTRFLTDDGRTAIRALFERSFGPREG